MGRLGIFGLGISLFFLALPASAQVSQKPLPGQDLANTWTNTNTFTGALNCKTLDAIICADAYTTPATVNPPSTSPGLTSTSTSGSVAANTYACEVTYNGATTGETTASSSSGTVVTSGATSTLFCAPNDAPAGALTYNVYWQTGGAGSFWKGHASVAFGTMDSQTTTPATSGTNPPVSNTATAVLAAAQAALSGGPGAIIIPSQQAANSGNPGDAPALQQVIMDFRNGSMSLWGTLPPSHNTESGSAMNDSFFVDVRPPVLGIRQQVNCIHGQMILGTPTWGNTLPISAGNCGFFSTYRFGSRAELASAVTAVILCANQNAVCEGQEIDTNNASGSDATTGNGGVGLNIFSVGANKAWIGLNITPSAPSGGFVSAALNIGDATGQATALAVGAQGGGAASNDSQVINLVAVNSGATRIAGAIKATQFGDISLDANSGFILVQKTGSQVGRLNFSGNTALRTYAFPDTSGPVPITPNLLISATAPIIAAAGCGGSAATVNFQNGTAAFEINVGTAPSSACTITMPAAAHHWICDANDITTNSTTVFYQKQSPAASQTTTQVMITNFSDVAAASVFIANDLLDVSCHAM